MGATRLQLWVLLCRPSGPPRWPLSLPRTSLPRTQAPAAPGAASAPPRLLSLWLPGPQALHTVFLRPPLDNPLSFLQVWKILP